MMDTYLVMNYSEYQQYYLVPENNGSDRIKLIERKEILIGILVGIGILLLVVAIGLCVKMKKVKSISPHESV